MARDDGVNAPAQVCCFYPEIAQPRRWKPDATPAPAPKPSPAQIDVYSEARGAIVERLTTGLHPHARWRDPREPSVGPSFRADATPLAHVLAGACVWLRSHQVGRRDVSADLLWCLVVRERCQDEAQAVRCALVAAWLDMHASIAVSARTAAGFASVERAAGVLVQACITGVAPSAKPVLQWKQWRMLQESGERMLWGLADRAARRAAEALR